MQTLQAGGTKKGHFNHHLQFLVLTTLWMDLTQILAKVKTG